MLSQLSQYIEMVPALVWAVALASLFALWLNRRSRYKIKVLQSELKQIRNDIKALTASSLGIGSRLHQLERKQRKIQYTDIQPAPVSASKPKPKPKRSIEIYEPANQPYDHAIHLAQQGKDVDEIVSICGVSQNEAELIRIMHRLEQAS